MALSSTRSTVSAWALRRLLEQKLYSTGASLQQPFGAIDNALVVKCAQQLEQIQQAGTYKLERQITTPQGASVGEACLIGDFK